MLGDIERQCINQIEALAACKPKNGERKRGRNLFHNNGGNQLFHSLRRSHKVGLASFFLLSLHLTAILKEALVDKLRAKLKILRNLLPFNNNVLKSSLSVE